MSYTKLTVNERLKILVIELQRALEASTKNEMITRQRVALLEHEVARLLVKCELPATAFSDAVSIPSVFETTEGET